MSSIQVTRQEQRAFGVHVDDGDEATDHRVTMSEGFLTDLGLAGEEPEAVVTESIKILLEREPPSSIQPELSLDEISWYLDSYYSELRLRLKRRRRTVPSSPGVEGAT